MARWAVRVLDHQSKRRFLHFFSASLLAWTINASSFSRSAGDTVAAFSSLNRGSKVPVAISSIWHHNVRIALMPLWRNKTYRCVNSVIRNWCHQKKKQSQRNLEIYLQKLQNCQSRWYIKMIQKSHYMIATATILIVGSAVIGTYVILRMRI